MGILLLFKQSSRPLQFSAVVLLYEVVGSLNIATQCALPPRMSPNLGQLNFFMLPLLIFFFIICCYKLAVFGAYFASGFMGTLLGPTFLKIYESV